MCRPNSFRVFPLTVSIINQNLSIVKCLFESFLIYFKNIFIDTFNDMVYNMLEVRVMDIPTKIKLSLTYAKISGAELARRIGTTSQNLNQRQKVGKYSTAELEAIATAMGAEFRYSFRFPDGTEI